MIVVKMHSDQIYKLKIEEQVFHIFHYQNFVIFASEHIFMTPNQSGRFSFQQITYIECNIHSDVLKSTWKQIKLTLCFLNTLLVLLCTIHWCTLIQRKKMVFLLKYFARNNHALLFLNPAPLITSFFYNLINPWWIKEIPASHFSCLISYFSLN